MIGVAGGSDFGRGGGAFFVVFDLSTGTRKRLGKPAQGLSDEADATAGERGSDV